MTKYDPSRLLSQQSVPSIGPSCDTEVIRTSVRPPVRHLPPQVPTRPVVSSWHWPAIVTASARTPVTVNATAFVLRFDCVFIGAHPLNLTCWCRGHSADAVPKVRVNGRREDVIFFDGVLLEPSMKSIFFTS